jgi:hypothetical protein
LPFSQPSLLLHLLAPIQDMNKLSTHSITFNLAAVRAFAPFAHSSASLLSASSSFFAFLRLSWSDFLSFKVRETKSHYLETFLPRQQLLSSFSVPFPPTDFSSVWNTNNFYQHSV